MTPFDAEQQLWSKLPLENLENPSGGSLSLLAPCCWGTTSANVMDSLPTGCSNSAFSRLDMVTRSGRSTVQQYSQSRSEGPHWAKHSLGQGTLSFCELSSGLLETPGSQKSFCFVQAQVFVSTTTAAEVLLTILQQSAPWSLKASSAFMTPGTIRGSSGCSHNRHQQMQSSTLLVNVINGLLGHRKGFGWNKNPVPVLSIVWTLILKTTVQTKWLCWCNKTFMEAHLAVVRLLSLYLRVWICLDLSQQGVVKSHWPAGKRFNTERAEQQTEPWTNS